MAQASVAIASVTTVIPCFNGGALVERALDSALAQTGIAVDVVVVDDGSTDGSTARLQRRALADPRIRCVSFAANRGPGPARNAGIALAGGDYLAFLDHDDWWRPGKLARQVQALRASGAALAYTGVELQDAGGRRLGYRRVPAGVGAEQLLVHNVIATSSVLLDRRAVPPFRMPPLRRRQDLATWYALLHAGVRALGLAEPLTIHTRRADSLSANKLVAARANWQLYRQHLARPLPAAASLFARYATAALLRV
jgi:teichuronic acid biosynthesis glycosyltransferase TuaG